MNTRAIVDKIEGVGFTGNYVQSQANFLKNAGYTGSLNEAWYNYLKSLGYQSHTLPELFAEWLERTSAFTAIDLSTATDDDLIFDVQNLDELVVIASGVSLGSTVDVVVSTDGGLSYHTTAGDYSLGQVNDSANTYSDNQSSIGHLAATDVQCIGAITGLADGTRATMRYTTGVKDHWGVYQSTSAVTHIKLGSASDWGTTSTLYVGKIKHASVTTLTHDFSTNPSPSSFSLSGDRLVMSTTATNATSGRLQVRYSTNNGGSFIGSGGAYGNGYSDNATDSWSVSASKINTTLKTTSAKQGVMEMYGLSDSADSVIYGNIYDGTNTRFNLGAAYDMQPTDIQFHDWGDSVSLTGGMVYAELTTFAEVSTEVVDITSTTASVDVDVLGYDAVEIWIDATADNDGYFTLQVDDGSGGIASTNYLSSYWTDVSSSYDFFGSSYITLSNNASRLSIGVAKVLGLTEGSIVAFDTYTTADSTSNMERHAGVYTGHTSTINTLRFAHTTGNFSAGSKIVVRKVKYA